MQSNAATLDKENTNPNQQRLNPFNIKNTGIPLNNASSKVVFQGCVSSREFGKDLMRNNTLTVFGNQNIFKNPKISENMLQEKIRNLKREKEELCNKLRNYEEMAQAFHKQKSLCSSMPNTKKNQENFSSDLGVNQGQEKDIGQIPLGNNVNIPKPIEPAAFADKNNFKKEENKEGKGNKIVKPPIPSQSQPNSQMEIEDFSKAQEKEQEKNKEKIEKDKVKSTGTTIGDLMNQEKQGISDEIFEQMLQKAKKKSGRPNPQDVDEYFDDIVKELYEKEGDYLVDPNYMAYQEDINERMRGILIDWLIEVHMKYKMRPDTMYICVNLIDRYLQLKPTKRTKLQLVGVTAMFIACKYEEIYPPELKDFVYITDKAYVKQDVLDMEIDMMKTLNYSVTFPTAWRFLEVFQKKLSLERKTFNMAYFLVELMLINYKILKYKMSEIAAAATLIATRIYRKYNAKAFTYATRYTEEQLLKCADEMSNFIYVNSKQHLQAIRKKFAHTKFDEVSKYQFF